MKFGSVCSGIEAASVAWNSLGWTAAWLSEIEPFPCAVLKHHYPDVPNLGDMTTLPERIMSGEVEAPDVFCGGTPCQAFSVAGLRNSLDDARGNLSLTFVGIANAIDHVRSIRRDDPAIIFWENVPGVLSTKDNAFGCFLGALAGEVEELQPPGGKWTNAGCVSGPKRTVAWRILDAQYFGVAQRRRRVFVVASAREDFDPIKVLFESDGLRRDIAPSREERKEAASSPSPSVAKCIVTKTRLDSETETFIPSYSIQDVRPIEKSQNGKGWNDDGSSYTIDTKATQGIAYPAYSIQGSMIGRNDNAGPQGDGINEEVCFTQNTIDRHAVAQPIVVHGTQDPCVSDIAFAQGRNNGGENAVFAPADVGPCMGSSGPPYSRTGNERVEAEALAIHNMQVRRLTPVECERLQGFPDNYTNIPWRKSTESPDGPRYKALGNSWAVPVVKWIGKRIQEHLK